MSQKSAHQPTFQKVLNGFKKDLSKKDKEYFVNVTSFEDLKISIGELQKTQNDKRRYRNLERLGPFLEAMRQWGQVVEVFCNSNEIVAFVWGPIKFILLSFSKYENVFNELLDTYHDIGENIPLLLQYQELFSREPDMVRVLTVIYEDILNFHRIAIQYFNQGLFRQFFSSTWKTQQARFKHIISDLARNRGLIESKARLLHMQAFDDSRQVEEIHHSENLQAFSDARQIAEDHHAEQLLAFEEARQIAESEQNRQIQLEEQRQSRRVFEWLRAPNTDIEHGNLLGIRKEYPSTGAWLLENPSFKEWIDPDYAKIPPLLWIKGIPGCGKTVLASLVVEEARKLKRKPTVLFFYCKHDNPEFNTFPAIARALLAQLLEQEKGLLPCFYQECCTSKEPILQTPEKIQKLLDTALAHCKSAYIVLDGLDECKREDRKEISLWFRERVDNLPPSEPWRLRCLFTSRDDGHGRKDFEDIDTININPSDIAKDLETFCQRQADLLRVKFQLTTDKADDIASAVSQRAAGMFLLPKLVWNNLSQQTTIASMERELEPSVYPKKLEDAYRRILKQMKSPDSRENSIPKDVKLILQWLTLARRPLEWREIQVLKSIDRQKQSIDFERQMFRVDTAKQLCGPLVNVFEDGTVELIHLTAKIFLVDEGYVDPLHGDIRMASLCVDYLNLPIFVGSISEAAALRGDYGFMEYAALYWVRHLEGAIGEAKRRIARTKLKETHQPEDSDDTSEAFAHPTLHEEEYSRIMSPLAESLGVFLEHHWASSRYNMLVVSDRNRRNMQVFEDYDIYDRLLQVFVSTRKQLHSFGPIKQEELATDIMDVVKQVRIVIEDAFTMSHGSGPPKDMVDRYGQNPFRCARFSCRSFTCGFPTPEERDNHVARHERPYRCDDEKCENGFDIGFATIAQYKRHMKDYHPDLSQRDQEFPTDKEIQLSIRTKDSAAQAQAQAQAQAEAAKTTSDSVMRNETAPSVNEIVTISDEEESSVGASEPDIPRPSRTKVHSKEDLKCQYCQKEFTRLYNLKSHLLVHQKSLKFPCDRCPRSFVRKSDLNRHFKSHTGEKRWVCGGCNTGFARSGTLKAHQQQSKKGQACLEDLERRQQQETENQDLILPSISSFIPN